MGESGEVALAPASTEPAEKTEGSQPAHTMDGEENLDLHGFSLTFGFTEVVGALVVIFIAVWLGHFEGGFAWQSDVKREFNWHPVLMTLGMIFLYGNAIMIYRVFRNERKKKLKLIHAVLNAVILILVIIALQAVFDSHNLSKPEPYPNMYTLHSWMGLSTVILFFCQWLAGLITFLFPGLRPPLRRLYMPIHIYFGLAIFLSAVATALMGMLEKAHWSIKDYGQLPPQAVLVNCTGLLMVVFAGLVIYLVTTPRFKRQALPEDELLLTDTIAE